MTHEGAGVLTLEEIGLAVVRIEGKIDLLASRNDAADIKLTDHEERIRTLESRAGVLKALEGKSVVTTKMFWSGIVGIATFSAAIAEILYVLKG
jgi:hypothetical protein